MRHIKISRNLYLRSMPNRLPAGVTGYWTLEPVEAGVFARRGEIFQKTAGLFAEWFGGRVPNEICCGAV